MPENKTIRIAVSGIYDYSAEEIGTLRLPPPGQGAPEWVEKKPLYRVYRPAPVLAAALQKFASLPLTHHHPSVPVDGANFRNLAVGWTGEFPEVDYIKDADEVGIKSRCVLFDDEALDAYERGEIQLSPGYVADFEWRRGTAPNGGEYDIIMKEILEVNHVALLPCGRGGADAAVLDGAPDGNDNASKEHVSREEEAEKILHELHANMIDFPEVEFNRDNYNKYLGSPIDTPIGKVKLGEHQFEKLETNKRTHLIGAIAETLKSPGYMGKDTDGKIIFIKSFLRNRNPHNVVSVLIERDGLKISISTHDKRDNQIKNIITRAEPLQQPSPDHGTVRDDRVAESTSVDELTITDNPAPVKSVFDIAAEKKPEKSVFEIACGSVFDRAAV